MNLRRLRFGIQQMSVFFLLLLFFCLEMYCLYERISEYFDDYFLLLKMSLFEVIGSFLFKIFFFLFFYICILTKSRETCKATRINNTSTYKLKSSYSCNIFFLPIFISKLNLAILEGFLRGRVIIKS